MSRRKGEAVRVVEGDGEGSSGVEDRGEEGERGKTGEERERRVEGE